MNKHKVLSDIELLHRLKQGDEIALTLLYNRYWDKLLAVACHRLNDPEAAEEIVQDVFISLWHRRQQLDIKFTLHTYLSVAVKYKIINEMDKQHRLRSKEQSILKMVQTEPSAEEYIFERELWERIEANVKQLPEKCQIVFRMSREEGLTNKQIASTLGVAEKTVEAHMSKALREIKGNLAVIAPPFMLLHSSVFHSFLKNL